MRTLILILLLTGCNNFFINKSENFTPLNIGISGDVISILSQGFYPDKSYDYWASIRSTPGFSEEINILYESGYTKQKINLPHLEGFIQGTSSVTDINYYILIVSGEAVNYIQNYNDLLEFFGIINTKEEALMLAMLKGFSIDVQNPKGSSFRTTKNGFEFLLFKNAPLPKIEYTQYLVRVDNKGNITSEKRDVYCTGDCECLKVGCENK